MLLNIKERGYNCSISPELSRVPVRAEAEEDRLSRRQRLPT